MVSSVRFVWLTLSLVVLVSEVSSLECSSNKINVVCEEQWDVRREKIICVCRCKRGYVVRGPLRDEFD